MLHHYFGIHVICLRCYLPEEFFVWSRSYGLACVGLSDGHSDQQLLMIICSFWRDVDASVLVNEVVHRSNSSLFTLCFMDTAKLAKSSFVHFRIQNLFNSKHISQLIVFVAAY
jgi:hypothetical protein